MTHVSTGSALQHLEAEEHEDHTNQTTSDMETSSDDIVMFKDSDFLPPASPATALLLESQFGWKSVPRMSSVEHGSAVKKSVQKSKLTSTTSNTSSNEVSDSLILRENSIIDALSLESAENKAKIQTITAQHRFITLSQRKEAMRAAQSAPSTPKTPAALTSEKSEITETYLQGTPSAVARYVSTTPSTAARKYLKTPGCFCGVALDIWLHSRADSTCTVSRPTVTWMVNEVDTEERVDDIVYLKTHQSTTNTENCSEEGMEFSDNNVFRSKFLSLRSQLKQALVVIGEQDRLIHEALLGKLHTMIDISTGAALRQSEADEQEDHAFITNNDVDANCDDIVMFKDSDFLPPASPATALLLESQFGWKSVPRMSSAVEPGSAVKKSVQKSKLASTSNTFSNEVS
eukprot:gene34697-42797_t